MTTEVERADYDDHDQEDEAAQTGLYETPRAAAPAATAPAYSRATPTAMPEKVPMTASLLSVVPGLGNIYNGLYARGIAFFLIQFSLFRIAVATERDEDLALLIPSLIFFWLFNIFDAYRQALLINLGGGDRVGETLRRSEAGGLLFPGLVLVGIGAIGAADRYLGFDLWHLFDHWPALILAAGVALVARAVLAKQRSTSTDLV